MPNFPPMLKRFLFLILLIITVLPARAQNPASKGVWQLSGLIVDKNSENQDPISYARIVINHSRRSMTADEKGFYSIPVLATDTVFFYALGYTPTFLSVGDYIKHYKGDTTNHYLYAIHYLEEDSIILPTVYIFPYQTPGELKAAILNAHTEQSLEEAHARNNLDPAVLDVLIKEMELDGEERVMVARQLYYNQQMQKNVAPTMPLFDPTAIYRLLSAIKDSNKKRRNNNLNYWLED